MSNEAVQIEGLTKIYKGELGQKDVLGLNDLNLEVTEGEVFAFLGPNGAGKTTTIKLMTRLIYPTKGKIRILGRQNDTRLAMENVGYLPEQPQMYGYLTGREFLDFIGRVFGLDTKTRRERISTLLEKVGLADKGDISIRGYSRGMMQRLGLAQALMNDPKLLILDEPMASLDPVGRKDFRDMILELRDRGKTIFFSSHILSDAEMVANRVGILNEGHLVNVGKLDELVGSQVNSVDITFEIDEGKLDKIKLDKERVIVSGRKVMIRLDREDAVPEILKRVDRGGGRIVSVVPQRKTLEEVFIGEVGR